MVAAMIIFLIIVVPILVMLALPFIVLWVAMKVVWYTYQLIRFGEIRHG